MSPEHSSTPAPAASAVPEPATPQMRLQILTTEHWSLLASRSLAWNEVFARAGMFLSTLSFAVVALALVGQATGFDETFRLFALVILPIILFLGISTLLRIDSANYHEAACVVGMNRIRAAYLELAPDIEPYLVMGTTDDLEGIVRTMALVPNRGTLANVLAATPLQVTVLNAILLAAIAALATVQLGASGWVGFAAGVIGFLVGIGAWALYDRHTRISIVSAHRPMFTSRP